MNLIKNRELRNDIMKTMLKNNDLTQGKIWKVILNFTLPIFLGTLFQSLYTTIDAIIVGKFAGKDAFAAIESVMSFQRLPVSFFIGLSSGATIIISQYFGAKEKEDVSKASHTAMLFAIVGGLILSILSCLLSPYFIGLIKVPQKIFHEAYIYTFICFSGMVFSMIYNTSQGQDVHFSTDLLGMGRNFANKIWNAARFVIMNLEGFDVKSVDKTKLDYELVDKWIISRLNETAKDVKDCLEKFELDNAAKAVYEFLRGDFCDWYVEIAKIRLYNDDEDKKISKLTAQYMLWTILEQGLRLLHPFMPFITEEIWQKIKVDGETIMLQQYPVADNNLIDVKIEKSFEYIKEVVSSLRNIRAEKGISPAKPAKVVVSTSNSEELETLEKNELFIKKLANLEELTCGANLEAPAQSSLRVAGNSSVYMILTGLLNNEAEIKKINEQLAKLEKELEPVNRKLSDEKFTSKAPQHIIDRELRIQKEYLDKIEKLKESLKSFEE